MSFNKDVNVLVVTHNHVEYIQKLIDSLLRIGVDKVFFCDALSTDGTAEILLDSPYASNVLKKDKLESFSRNNNDLIRHFNLDSKCYLLLNPDTYFEEDFISPLYEEMEKNESIGIICPVIKYPSGELQISWKSFPNFRQVILKRTGVLKSKNEKFMEGPNIDWCLGACMLISSRLLKSDKTLLDERYRLYCEDIDICFESHQRGLKVIGFSGAEITHHLNETSAKNIFSKYNLWNISSIVKFILKWNISYFKS
ncbi:glycosyltransferase [Mangrovimonas xylaniphaga]|uniref:glycosyltransferase n=1 Tax=Mangrovimonas xylaniphaga TaxID=1645915 RepID=UPI0006B6087D|nr:glycosyltransferase family 2 protein [Mangrovimonas xylaniphaga]